MQTEDRDRGDDVARDRGQQFATLDFRTSGKKASTRPTDTTALATKQSTMAMDSLVWWRIAEKVLLRNGKEGRRQLRAGAASDHNDD